MDNNPSYKPGDDKYAMASERNQYPPPSYNYGIEISQSPASPHAFPKTAHIPAEKYTMRDDERYPTVVEVEIPPGLIHYAPQEGESSAASANTISPLSRTLAAHTTREPASEEASERRPGRKILGLSRRRFLMIATGVGFLMLCASIIGIAVLVTVRDQARTRYAALTVSGVFVGEENAEWNMQIVHTNMTSGAISLRSNNGTGGWTPDQALNFTIVPDLDAAMTVTSVLGTDGLIYINLFYIHDSNIVLANITCDSEECTTLSNDIITKDITYPIHKQSPLDSVYIKSSGYRVFYHNTDKYITQLSSSGDGTWSHGAAISGKALSGSSISASILGESGNILMMYVDAKKKQLYNVIYDVPSGKWRNPTAILSDPIDQWDPVAAITSNYMIGSDTLSVYFTGSDSLVYQLSATNASTEAFSQISRGALEPNSTTGISTAGWDPTPYRDLSWQPSDGVGAEIASLGWQTESTFFRLIDGKLAESTERNGVWSATYI
ncbi:hypothetical protein B2J93_2974 [Marssonina coronariae]|uniref:Uncharacterized protein n=1 Tax=Diplocarpon coronariae TaxID=2795749 RepID=A0A218Z650_9HELO|nr:hypothetical protein B2J93_2974 [Marssonina coronariae]